MLKSIKTNSDFPVTVENHPSDYSGYDFVTLIRYNDEVNLIIVDNVHKRHIDAYCLDLCLPKNVDEQMVIKVANYWYHTSVNNYPLSIEFSKRGLSSTVAPILISYPVDYITRIIGPVVPQYYVGNPTKVRKRKRKSPKECGLEVVTHTYFKSLMEVED